MDDDLDGIEPGVLYVVVNPNGPDQYAVTPDGVGMYWHDTREEAMQYDFMEDDAEEIEISDDDLEELRNPGCPGHPDDDYSISAGMPAGETHYCDGSCRR